MGTVRRLRLPRLGVISTSEVGVKVDAAVERLVGTEWDTAGCRAPHDDAAPISAHHFHLAEELRSALWVPNWSSTAVTCDIAGSGSPTLLRASPFESRTVLVAALTSLKHALDHRQLAEPITAVIIDASARATEGSATGAPSSHAGSH